MSDREKMMESIFNAWDLWPGQDDFMPPDLCELIADSLIEAGFRLEKKCKKSLCPSCIHNGTEVCSDWKYAQPVRSCNDYVRKP